MTHPHTTGVRGDGTVAEARVKVLLPTGATCECVLGMETTASGIIAHCQLQMAAVGQSIGRNTEDWALSGLQYGGMEEVLFDKGEVLIKHPNVREHTRLGRDTIMLLQNTTNEPEKGSINTALTNLLIGE